MEMIEQVLNRQKRGTGKDFLPGFEKQDRRNSQIYPTERGDA